MRGRRIGALGVAAALGAGLWVATRSAPPERVAPPASAPKDATPRPADSAPPQASFESDALAALPELERRREALAFRDGVRAFFDGHAALAPDERERRAAEILAGVDARERDGRLVPAEALMLRLALLRATIDDPAVLDHEIAVRVDAYREAAERARTARAPDPRDGVYRDGQAAIVREVMALDEIPDGLSREAYLRERLRALRAEVYAPEPGEAEGSR